VTSWQDLTFTVVGLFFVLSLLPTVFNRRAKVPRRTSIPTAVGLLIIAVTDYTIRLYYSAAGSVLSALTWSFIAAWRPVKPDLQRTFRIHIEEVKEDAPELASQR
jgi:hypothetical protein